MKKKNLLALLLALIFTFTSVLPGFAAEEELPSVTEQEETDPVQPPEDGEDVTDSEEAEPEPESDESPDLPDEPGEPSEETSEEPPEIEAPEEVPSEEETPDGETPDEEVPSGEDGTEEDTGGEEEEDEEDGDGGEEVIIDVVVPARGRVVINPYHMEVDTRYGSSTDQIVHDPQELISYTEFPVQVSVQAAGLLQWSSDAYFVTRPPADDEEDKQIFMYVEFQEDPTYWFRDFGDWENQILITEWGEEKENVLTLDAYGTGYFRLLGAMSPYPDAMWSSDDVMDVVLTFTFSPLSPEDEDGPDAVSGMEDGGDGLPGAEDDVPDMPDDAADNTPGAAGDLPDTEDPPADAEDPAPDPDETPAEDPFPADAAPDDPDIPED